MSSFARLQQQNHAFVKKLVEFSGLDYSLVENIVQYARCLPTPGHTELDQNVFVAQMSQQFGLTSAFMLGLTFHGLKGERSNVVTLESFCECICTFLCDNLDHKINYVFNVYDTNKDGSLSYLELYTFLKPCILHNEFEEMDAEDSLRELIELVISVTDRNANGQIELEEFRRLVKKDILYIQLLGPCLPTDVAIEKFRQRMSNRCPFDIRREFEHERYRCLNEFVPTAIEDTLYPIKLQMP